MLVKFPLIVQMVISDLLLYASKIAKMGTTFKQEFVMKTARKAIGQIPSPASKASLIGTSCLAIFQRV